MTAELDALRQTISEQLVGVGVRLSAMELDRISATILAEAVRISVEWVEAPSGF